MRLIYMIAADVLRALGWEVEINEKENYWNLVLANTTSSEDMPESHKSCLRGLLRGWLMEFNYEGGRQQVNIYKELHGLDPEDDRYSCLDTCVNRTDGNTPQYKLYGNEIFVRRKDRFDRYVLTESIDEPLTTRLTCGSKFNPDKTKDGIQVSAVYEDEWKLPKKKKRPKVLSMFYALLICLLYVAIAVGVNILPHKLFGFYYGLDLITFSMVFSAIWVLCYIHISED